MDETYFDLLNFFKNPSFTETFVDILLCAVPIWLAVMIGLLIGWSWRPRWTGLIYLGFRSKLRFLWTAPPGFGARRLWLAFTALSAFSVCRTIWSRNDTRANKSATGSASSQTPVEDNDESGLASRGSDNRTVTEDIVTENDLEHLLQLLEVGNAALEWQSMMDKTTPNMSYQAWRHEPETGPVIYRSRTVFEDATPDIVRDFFWDDEFRPKWDFMLANFKTLEEDTQTGTMIVQWRKKVSGLLILCDREYIIGRRIWESGKKYYCVTKGVPYPALPKRDKPRRVELYFSSWVIRAVESRKGDGQQTACEVSLVHYEDMGIPKDVAKLGVRHGMWGAVKKLNSGLRAYQSARKSDSSLSRIAQMARITTKLNMDSAESSSRDEDRSRAMEYARQRDHLRMDWKWVVVGGVALACGLHSGIIGKALLAGAGQRLARR
ncbi:putative START domain-containing protein [Arabidopsis thaliana]